MTVLERRKNEEKDKEKGVREVQQVEVVETGDVKVLDSMKWREAEQKGSESGKKGV